VLTRSWTKLRYHEGQARLWRTRARFVAVACGRGSGKTELARRRIVRFLPIRKPWPDPMYFYALPTYSQARRVAWRKIRDLIPPDWVSKLNESNMVVDTVFGSSLYIVGMDKPQRIEGDQWDGGVIDESCDQRPRSFDLSVRPALSHRDGWCWRIGVPKRYGVGAPEFKTFFDKGMTGDDSRVEAYTWPSSDILTAEAIEFAQQTLDARDYNEQYNAQWETASGLIFYAYVRADNVRRVDYFKDRPLLVGSDFNVDPMAWVVAQRDEDKLYVLDELFLRNTNTQQTLDELFKRYGRHESGFEFYGDATGRARKTSASSSDYIQIRQDSRFAGARVFYPRSNPPVADRFAACNAMFRNAKGVQRLFVDPRCVNLIRDLETRAYREGTREPDDYGDVGHITDALGYVVYRLFPVALSYGSAPPKVKVR